MIEDVQNSLVKERALLIGIYGADTMRWQAEEYIEELNLLADTAGAQTVGKLLQNRVYPDPATYVGKGKLQELKHIVGDENVDTLIFDDDLSATQIRNIEKSSKAKVLDRSGLILDIFASRAKTAAAKTQVELAQLQYVLPRLTRFWTHLSRQKGGIGTKGPGETQIETDRRLIGQRISTLKEKLEKLDKQRTTQRKQREGLVRIALVGYTNAGKSTLMNTITETDVLAEDRLFATLDSTVRKLNLENHKALLSDTVGFIRKLPHNLIESFKSTLDEVREADLLLHVVDASSALIDDYITVVDDTLEEIGIKEKRRLLVFNKIDKVDPARITELKKLYPGGIFTSSVRSIGLTKLLNRIGEIIEEDYVHFNYRIPLKYYKAVAFLHEVAIIEREHYDENDVIIKGRAAKEDCKKFDAMLKKLDNVA
ncbi:MAG TPA: GTPase HflX [Balneolaceae bacterium]|nr:GTPase HflX [Balneolaceae bacterium]